MLLRDLSLVEQGNPKHADEAETLINCDRICLLADLLTKFREMLAVEYHLKRVHAIDQVFGRRSGYTCLTEDEAHALSCQLEV